MKTSELTGPALDWAVARAIFLSGTARSLIRGEVKNYSTDWAEGGPIIEREGISVCYDVELCNMEGHEYWATQYSVGSGEGISFGPTPLIAAMRCYCCAELGDEIEIPEELK